MDLVTLAAAKKYARDKIAEASVGNVDVTEYVNARVDEVIGGASGTFDTLGEIETVVKKKVDKVSGKGLSTNDYTTADKNKLASIEDNANAYVHPSTHDVGIITGLATVSKTGSYNDLKDKPTIPSVNGFATTEYVDNAVASAEFILNSITEGSTKKFRITVDDNATLTAVEIVE